MKLNYNSNVSPLVLEAFLMLAFTPELSHRNRMVDDPNPNLNPTPNPDECPPLPDYAAHLEMDLANEGKPGKMTPEEGIRLMQQRIAGLKQELSLTHHAAPTHPEAAAHCATLESQIADAKSRLSEYQLQLQGRN